MNCTTRKSCLRQPRLRALTLAEAAVSVAIVGIMLVAALNTVGVSATIRQAAGDRARGRLLAEQLMTEIQMLPYRQPGTPPGTFGLGAGEGDTGNRSLYNDVDDYYNWCGEPPEDKDGNDLPGFEGWKRCAVVAMVAPNNLDSVQSSDDGVKRIIVTTYHNDRLVAKVEAIRTDAWDEQYE